jgi:hypothetical protein
MLNHLYLHQTPGVLEDPVLSMSIFPDDVVIEQGTGDAS